MKFLGSFRDRSQDGEEGLGGGSRREEPAATLTQLLPACSHRNPRGSLRPSRGRSPGCGADRVQRTPKLLSRHRGASEEYAGPTACRETPFQDLVPASLPGLTGCHTLHKQHPGPCTPSPEEQVLLLDSFLSPALYLANCSSRFKTHSMHHHLQEVLPDCPAPNTNRCPSS